MDPGIRPLGVTCTTSCSFLPFRFFCLISRVASPAFGERRDEGFLAGPCALRVLLHVYNCIHTVAIPVPMARFRENRGIAGGRSLSCRAFWQAFAVAAGTGCQNGRSAAASPRTATRVLAADAAANVSSLGRSVTYKDWADGERQAPAAGRARLPRLPVWVAAADNGDRLEGDQAISSDPAIRP